MGAGDQRTGLTDFDRRVLDHLTQYPGLSIHELGRVMGVVSDRSRHSCKIMFTLMRLMQAGQVRFVRVEAQVRGSYKHLWYPA